MNSFNKISLCERMWNVDAFHTQSLNFINGNDYDDDIASFTLSKGLPCQKFYLVKELVTHWFRYLKSVKCGWNLTIINGNDHNEFYLVNELVAHWDDLLTFDPGDQM